MGGGGPHRLLYNILQDPERADNVNGIKHGSKEWKKEEKYSLTRSDVNTKMR